MRKSAKESERERYEAELKRQRDEAMRAGLQMGFEEAWQDAFAKGLEQGLKQGELIGRIRVCQRLLSESATPKRELVKLTVERLANMAQDLEKLIGT